MALPPAQTTVTNISCLGDSLSDIYFRANQAWSYYVPYYFQNARVSADGVSGNDTTNVIARLQSNGIHTFSPGDVTDFGNPPTTRRGRCYVQIGVNDIIYSTNDAPTMKLNLAYIYQWLTQNGWTPYPMTVWPFGAHTAWTTAMETVRTTVNTWIVTQPRAINMEPVLANTATAGQPKMWTQFVGADGLHENQAGARLVALYVRLNS